MTRTKQPVTQWPGCTVGKTKYKVLGMLRMHDESRTQWLRSCKLRGISPWYLVYEGRSVKTAETKARKAVEDKEAWETVVYQVTPFKKFEVPTKGRITRS